MKLYYAKGACSLAVRIIINEIGLTAEYESVNLKTKKTETGADFLKISQKGAVPTLITDQEEVLTENVAIQQYLADTHNASQLLPATRDFKRYRVVEWLNFVSTEMHKGCSPLFNPAIPQEVKESIFIANLKAKLNFLEQRLSENRYLVGDTFTLPDAYLFVVLTWFPSFKLDLAEWPHVARYFAELKTRKSIQQSLKEEGLIEKSVV